MLHQNSFFVRVFFEIPLGLALAIAATPAASHGWYPKHCCGDKDCFVVESYRPHPDGSVTVTLPTGRVMTVPRNYPWKELPDAQVHVCVQNKGFQGWQVVCAWRAAAS